MMEKTYKASVHHGRFDGDSGGGIACYDPVITVGRGLAVRRRSMVFDSGDREERYEVLGWGARLHSELNVLKVSVLEIPLAHTYICHKVAAALGVDPEKVLVFDS
jgi:hypothetical protein